jgi:hypothetical protein
VLEDPGAVFDKGVEKAPSLSKSVGAAAVSGKGAPISEQVVKDPRMIALQDERQKLDAALEQLKSERDNAPTGAAKTELTMKIIEKEKERQQNVHKIFQTEQKIETEARTAAKQAAGH